MDGKDAVIRHRVFVVSDNRGKLVVAVIECTVNQIGL